MADLTKQPVKEDESAVSPGFTPGPWRRDANPSLHLNRVWTQDMRPIVSLLSMSSTIAEYDPEAQANGDLIAAAPDGYAAAKDALAGWRYIRKHHGDLYGVGWDRVENALADFIAKAEGRSDG